jgi:hypothetical protein
MRGIWERLQRRWLDYQEKLWELRASRLEAFFSRLAQSDIHLGVDPNRNGRPYDAAYVGTALGRPAEYRVIFKGDDSFTTEALVEVPCHGLEVNIRPHGLLARFVDSKPALTGDPRFDRAYVLRGAPERGIKRVFDAEVRAWVLAQRPACLRVADDEVFLQKDGALDDADSIRIILLGLVRIAERLAMVGEARGYRSC